MRIRMFKNFIEKPIAASEFFGKVFFLVILIILFLAIINHCQADWIELKDSSRVEGTIVGKTQFDVTLKTDIGMRIISRDDIKRIFFTHIELPALEMKTTHRCYLIPVFAGLALLTADFIIDADRMDTEIRNRKEYGLDTSSLDPKRKYIFGFFTGMASVAVLAFILDDVDVAVMPNQVQVNLKI